jgi:branched-chain amino acid transport system permease protein
MGFVFRRPADFFYLIWGLVAGTYILFGYLENSRFGRALKFIKEDPLAAEGMGINVTGHKLMAFVIGAAWAGLAGTVFASYMRTVSPESFTFGESVTLFAIVILGGSGNRWGVLVGAFLVVGLPEIFRRLEDYRLLVYGAALVLMMIFRPQGLFPPKPSAYALPEPWKSRYPSSVGNGSKSSKAPPSGQRPGPALAASTSPTALALPSEAPVQEAMKEPMGESLDSQGGKG